MSLKEDVRYADKIYCYYGKEVSVVLGKRMKVVPFPLLEKRVASLKERINQQMNICVNIEMEMTKSNPKSARENPYRYAINAFQIALNIIDEEMS